jgi:uridine phosphorylase
MAPHNSHVGVKRGELANRVLTVGDPARAMVLSRSLDGVDPATPAKTVPTNLFSYSSHRGFLTITGRYKGVPVSIVAIGMLFFSSYDACLHI